MANLLFCGCDRIINTKHTTNEIIVNKTIDKLVYVIETDVGNDTIFSNGLDSNYVVFVKNSTTNLPVVGPYSIYINRIEILRRYLFNLSDTLSFISPNNDMNKDSIFYNSIKFNGVTTGSIYNLLDTERLIISKETKLIFNKDYTMLAKFKDYYKK